jgi:hypothetical protein
MNIEEMYPRRAHRQFTSMAREMQDEIKRAREPKLKAMLRNSARVLNNLANTFENFDER